MTVTTAEKRLQVATPIGLKDEHPSIVGGSPIREFIFEIEIHLKAT